MSLIANLRHAARNCETVTIGGGQFGPNELAEGAKLMAAGVQMHTALETDVKALAEAQIVLQTIKDIDPGVYDEMIDNALRLIADALKLQVTP